MLYKTILHGFIKSKTMSGNIVEELQVFLNLFMLYRNTIRLLYAVVHEEFTDLDSSSFNSELFHKKCIAKSCTGI